VEKLNTGRKSIGLDSIPSMGTSNRAAPNHGPAIPKRQCPFGAECRYCKIAISKDGKLECAIWILASAALKEGIKVGGKI